MEQFKQKIAFILHGKLKHISKHQDKILEVFSKEFNVVFKTTSLESGAKKCTNEALTENADIIVICGGDGSINETANGFLTTKTDKIIYFGVLPMGTGNDFAKSLHVKNDLLQLKELIVSKRYIEVDVFKMDYNNKLNKKESRYFVNIADIGIGGFVAEHVGNSSKVLGSNLTYMKAIVSSFIKYKKQPIQLTSSTFNWSGQILSLCMANGKYFGSGMCIAPDAQLDDGKLQLTILGNVSLLDYIKNISKIKKGVKIDHKEAKYATVTNCKVVSKGLECPIDMDGEFIGYTPIEVELHSQKLNFFSLVQ